MTQRELMLRELIKDFSDELTHYQEMVRSHTIEIARLKKELLETIEEQTLRQVQEEE